MNIIQAAIDHVANRHIKCSVCGRELRLYPGHVSENTVMVLATDGHEMYTIPVEIDKLTQGGEK